MKMTEAERARWSVFSLKNKSTVSGVELKQGWLYRGKVRPFAVTQWTCTSWKTGNTKTKTLAVGDSFNEVMDKVEG